jgi:hypothetical protein
LCGLAKNPIARFVVWSFLPPSPKHVGNLGIHGNRLARNFCLAGSNDLTANRAGHVQFELIESHIFPLQIPAVPHPQTAHRIENHRSPAWFLDAGEEPLNLFH